LIPRSGVLVLVLGCAVPAAAQDSQYWNLQYGPVAELLGGVVVGSSRDLSATFYNPGALSLAKNPSLVASVNSFEAVRIKAETRAPDVELEDTRVRPSPSLFAIALPRSWTGSHTIAISALTRQDLDLTLDDWFTTAGNGVSGEALFRQDMTESWFGLTWAHPVGRRFGVGVTSYVAYRGQSTRRELSGASVAGGGASALLIDDFDYSHYRLVWKGGVAHQRENWDLGLTVTTKSVGLFGSGSASQTRSVVGPGASQPSAVAAQHEEDLASRYESPWSVAVGAAHRRGPNTFHAAAEWFGSVDPYDVLDAAPFSGNPAADSLVKRLQQQAKSVVNFGAGYERRVNERFSWYGAFTTDFTYADRDNQGENALSTWNIFHVTAGTSLTLADGPKLTLGAAYAFGGDTRQITVIDVTQGGPPVVTSAPADTQFGRLRVLFGFDFGN
jgi:hypothetical protein